MIRLKGIDVSYANGSIDWNKTKHDVDFAIIRSSFGLDLPSQTDRYFFQNADGCKKNGIPFGTYHFAYFVDVDTAKKEADFAIRLANEYKDDIRFIALDMEEDSERYAQRVGKSPNWTECAIAFMEKVKKAGFIPVLYSNQSWLQSRLNYEKLRQYKLWYAAPGASAPKYSCDLWQYSWTGSVASIRGNVDMDYCYDETLFSKTAPSAPKKERTTIDQLVSSQKVDYLVEVEATNGVNIRRGAGTNYEKLGAAPFKAQLRITRATSGGTYLWGLTEYNGIKGWIATDFTKRISKSISKGDTVSVRKGAKVYGTDQSLSTWVYDGRFTVIEVSNDRAVIGINGQVTAAVSVKDLISVS